MLYIQGNVKQCLRKGILYIQENVKQVIYGTRHLDKKRQKYESVFFYLRFDS